MLYEVITILFHFDGTFTHTLQLHSKGRMRSFKNSTTIRFTCSIAEAGIVIAIICSATTEAGSPACPAAGSRSAIRAGLRYWGPPYSPPLPPSSPSRLL